MDGPRLKGRGSRGPRERARLFPDRARVLARTRATARAVLLVAFAIIVLVSWAVSVLVLAIGQPARDDLGWIIVWLAVAQLGLLAVLVVVASALGRVSTLPIEHIFRQEDRVIRSAAHELRNPITRLLTVADEGLNVGHDPAASLSEVVDEAEALSQLVDDMAQSLQVMAGNISLTPIALRLDQVVSIPPARLRLGEVEMRVESEPGTVRANPRLLRLALINLVHNAAQHAYGGGPGVVVVRADQQGISVIDDGPGMDPAQITEVLTNPTRALSRHVAGLGLPLVNWVAEVHGGRLRLVNRPEGGLEARLELPVDPTDPDVT